MGLCKMYFLPFCSLVRRERTEETNGYSCAVCTLDMFGKLLIPPCLVRTRNLLATTFVSLEREREGTEEEKANAHRPRSELLVHPLFLDLPLDLDRRTFTLDFVLDQDGIDVVTRRSDEGLADVLLGKRSRQESFGNVQKKGEQGQKKGGGTGRRTFNRILSTILSVSSCFLPSSADSIISL